jgi:hypothetical protein
MLAKNLCKYNPIDDIECMFLEKQHSTERRSDNEIVVQVSGKWDNMLLFFAWEEQLNCLHLSCMLNIEPQNVSLPTIFELLALLNEDIWVGHFSYWQEAQTPLFRHSLFIDETDAFFTEKLAQVVHIAMTECERAYPIFHAVFKQNISPRRALLPMTLM